MTMPEPVDVRKAIGEWLVDLCKKILMTAAVASVLGGATWSVLRPFAQDKFSEWYDNASADLNRQVSEIATTNREILIRLSRVDERNLLEFNGSPVIVPPATVRPGETIAILYSLKRTVNCETEIEVHFISGALQRINASLSYTIQAVRSRVSDEFGNIVIDVRIPENAEPGWYSYAPRAEPIGCPGYAPVQVPPSPFFEVIPHD